VRADVTLRLGNLQVVNKFDDGEERFARDWMRQNERGMASLAWEMAAVRERRGFGSIKVLHQLGHPEKRKAAADYDVHERCNVKVDALTHAITPDMPLYISCRRTGQRHLGHATAILGRSRTSAFPPALRSTCLLSVPWTGNC